MHILIPKPGALQRKRIKTGSGIVAVERTDGSADIYYEGNLYGAENLRSYWGRLLRAASRLAQQYPTVARLVDDNWNESFELIGTFDYDGISKAFESDPHQSPDDIIKQFCQIEPTKYSLLIDWLQSQDGPNNYTMSIE